MQSARFEIEGMSCGHCVGSIENALRSVPGVEVRSVDVGSAEVAFEPATATKDAVLTAIGGAGFRARETGAVAATNKRGGCSCCSG